MTFVPEIFSLSNPSYLSSDPGQIASKISGISPKMVVEMQKNAKALLSA